MFRLFHPDQVRLYPSVHSFDPLTTNDLKPPKTPQKKPKGAVSGLAFATRSFTPSVAVVPSRMADESAIRHLTEYEQNDSLDEQQDRTPEDRIDFALYFDSSHVQPWSKGSNEITRLYFDDEEISDAYVPVTYAERIEEEIRSSPIGDPRNDADESWADLSPETELEQGAEINGTEFDLLWLRKGDEDETVVAAAEFGGN